MDCDFLRTLFVKNAWFLDVNKVHVVGGGRVRYIIF